MPAVLQTSAALRSPTAALDSPLPLFPLLNGPNISASSEMKTTFDVPIHYDRDGFVEPIHPYVLWSRNCRNSQERSASAREAPARKPAKSNILGRPLAPQPSMHVFDLPSAATQDQGSLTHDARRPFRRPILDLHRSHGNESLTAFHLHSSLRPLSLTTLLEEGQSSSFFDGPQRSLTRPAAPIRPQPIVGRFFNL